MNEGYEIQLTEGLKNAWGVFSKAPEVFVGIAFALLALSITLAGLPIVGAFLGLLISALGPACIFLAAEEGYQKDAASFHSLEVIPTIFPQLLALFVVKAVLIGLGFFFLILPGIYLTVTLVFAELYVVVERKTFLEALKASHSLASRNLLGVLGMGIILGALACSGALLVGLGLLVTVPLALLTLHAVFRRIHLNVIG